MENHNEEDTSVFVDYQFAFDFSAISEEEKIWYEKLGDRLGISMNEAIIYHAVLIQILNPVRAPYEYNPSEGLNGYFPKESPKNRKLLIGILEKMANGETLPEF